MENFMENNNNIINLDKVEDVPVDNIIITSHILCEAFA